ncbi:multidrug transporter, partial [Ralstonia solanacearum]
MNRALKRWDLRRAACSALALALAGCVTAPDTRGPALASPEAALRSRAAVVSGEPALTAAAVPSQWWDLFDDATLMALEAEATESNLDLQSAATRIEESRARLGLADAARQPQLAAAGGYSRSAISHNSPLALLGAPTRGSDTWLFGLEAGWELDLWGRLRHLSESAEANLEASGYGKEA